MHQIKYKSNTAQIHIQVKYFTIGSFLFNVKKNMFWHTWLDTLIHRMCSVSRYKALFIDTFIFVCWSECADGVCGFPMSQFLKDQACFCGRNARMSACLVSLAWASQEHLTSPTRLHPHLPLHAELPCKKCYNTSHAINTDCVMLRYR